MSISSNNNTNDPSNEQNPAHNEETLVSDRLQTQNSDLLLKKLNKRLCRANGKERAVQLFKNAWAVEPSGTYNLRRTALAIAAGQAGIRQRIEQIRKLYAEDPEGNEKRINKLKRGLPAVSVSAILRTRDQGVPLEEKLDRHTGLIQGDIDAKDNPGKTYEVLRRISQEYPHSAVVFRSPNGCGVKIIALCPADEKLHLGSFLALEKYFADRGVTIDTKTKDITRLMFLSHDPELWVNEAATEVVPLECSEEPPAKAAPKKRTKRKNKKQKSGGAANGSDKGSSDIPVNAPSEVLTLAERRFPHTFRPLYFDGDWETKYESQSDADHALVFMLCAVSPSDDQVEDLFHKSSLDRDKAARPDYLPRSIKKARATIANREFGSAHLMNDKSNADRLVAKHQGDIRFVPEWGTWLVWGVRWKRDDELRIIELSKGLGEMIREDAIKEQDLKRQENLHKFAVASGNAAKVKAAVDLAKSDPRIIAHSSEFDADPFLLGVRNGVVNLKTGKFREARREDMISKQAAVAFDPEAKCPMFEGFMMQFACDAVELVAFLQRYLGYNLTGDTSEHALCFAHGAGSNGKTTLFGAILSLLGDYSQAAPKSLFTADPRGGNGPTNDMARLEGVRMVVGSEVEQGTRWAEAKIKDLTGGDVICARFNFKEFFDFKPTHKLTIFGNHKPNVRGVDEGIWRRIHLVPCLMHVEKKDRVKNLDQKLLEEAPGILNWLIEGCLQWQKNGLQPPKVVQRATAEYRSDEDHFGRFVRERIRKDKGRKTLKGEAFNHHKDWCEGENVRPGGACRFHKLMEERGFETTGDDKYYLNISILPTAGLLMEEEEFEI